MPSSHRLPEICSGTLMLGAGCPTGLPRISDLLLAACSKVMFLHLSMILFMGGCLADTPLGRYPPRQTTTPPPSRRWPLQWMVHILLKCILVNLFLKNYLMINYQATRNLLGHPDLQSWVPDWATAKKFLNHRLIWCS